MAKQKLAFYEIDNGKLAINMQRAFERVQTSAINEGVNTKVTLEIEIHSSKDEKYGGVSYQIKEKHPAKKSIKLTTELDNAGLIVGNGTNIVDVMQEELFNSELKIANIEGK